MAAISGSWGILFEKASLRRLNVDALTLRWPCPKQTKTTAVLAGVRVREGCETGSKQERDVGEVRRGAQVEGDQKRENRSVSGI